MERNERTRALTRLRVERFRQRLCEDGSDSASDIDGPSSIDVGLTNTMDIEINGDEYISIGFCHDTNSITGEFRTESLDLDISDEFSQLEESMKLDCSEQSSNTSCHLDGTEINYDEATLSEEEENNFHYHEEEKMSEEELLAEEVEVDEIEELRQWALKARLPQTHLDDLLKILRNEKFPKLPKSSKTFLRTSSATYKIKTFDDNCDSEFVYFGVAEHLKRTINVTLHPNRWISLLIHIDGSSPYKSSTKQFWPILGKVYLESDLYEVFPIALYSGVGKPKNIHQFFHGFVQEMNILMKDGIVIEGKSFDVDIKAFICDRPARSLVKCVKNHGAKHACERCDVAGTRVEQRTVYLSTEAAERTDESFRNQQDPLHHDGISPLTELNPPIDFIKDFVLDIMHLLWLGIMKKFLVDIWMKGPLATRFSYAQKNLFSSYLLMMKSQVPREFQRSTASLTDVGKWKATQFRFLALYAGPIILKKCLDEKLYKHFLLFHVASRILSCKHLAISFNSKAKRFLRLFVVLSEKLYGQFILVLNLHSLLHVADDAMNLQCSLSEVNAFPFESALGRIKHMLRTGYRPLAQICRRIHEQFFANTSKPEPPPAIKVLNQLRPDASGKISIKKIEFKNTILTTKSPDNSILLKTGEIIQVDNMFILPTETEIRVSGKTLQIKKAMFDYPVDSTALNMFCVSRRKSQEFRCNLKDIRHKMVTLDVSTEGKEEIYTMPLLHS